MWQMNGKGGANESKDGSQEQRVIAWKLLGLGGKGQTITFWKIP